MKGGRAIEIFAVGFLAGAMLVCGLEGAAEIGIEKVTGWGPVVVLNGGGYLVGVEKSDLYKPEDEMKLLELMEHTVWSQPGKRKCGPLLMPDGSGGLGLAVEACPFGRKSEPTNPLGDGIQANGVERERA